MRILKYKLQVTSYKLQVIFLASCILHLASSISFAESLKIGYVDIQKALNQSTAGKSAMEKLKKDIEKETTILKEKEEDIKRIEDELNKQGLMMKDTERDRKSEEYRRKGRDLERYREDVKRDIMIKEREMTDKIVSELVKVVQKIGQEEGFTIILERGNTVLFASDSIDITEKLIKRYDEQKR